MYELTRIDIIILVILLALLVALLLTMLTLPQTPITRTDSPLIVVGKLGDQVVEIGRTHNGNLYEFAVRGFDGRRTLPAMTTIGVLQPGGDMVRFRLVHCKQVSTTPMVCHMTCEIIPDNR